MYGSVAAVRIELNQPDIKYMDMNTVLISPSFYNYKHIILSILFFIWLSIVVIKLIYSIWVNLNYYNMIVTSAREIDQEAIHKIKEQLVQDLKIKKTVQILCSKEVQSPILLNILRPIIILPEYSFTADELSLIIAHELVHYRSKDIMVYRLVMCLQMFHFFNPFVNMFINHLIDTSELACDETVLKNATKNTRIIYANLILKISKNLTINNPSKLSINTLAQGGMVTNIKRRLTNIMNMKVKKVKIASMTFISVIYFILCPIVIYASTTAGLMTQSAYVKHIASKKNIYESSESLKEFVQPINHDITELNLRDLNKIDYNLAPNKEVRVKVTPISDKIRVALFSDNSFDVGIGEGDKIRYVSSTEGMVSHIFSVQTNKTYYIYIKNTSTETNHITGQIYI